MIRISNYIGKKDRFLKLIRDVMPIKFKKIWETHAGTASVTVNLALGMELDEMVVTELDKGQYMLLKEIQQHPQELAAMLLKTEFTEQEFMEAAKAEGEHGDYPGCSDIEVAYYKYILNNQSFNGGGSITGSCLNSPVNVAEWRKQNQDKPMDVYLEQCYGALVDIVQDRQVRDRYQRHILNNVLKGSEHLKNIQIIHKDMMDLLDDMVMDEDRFIFVDAPYANDADRPDKLYTTDTEFEWHEKFCQRLVWLHSVGRLRAKIMICGNIKYSGDDFGGSVAGKVYNKYLLEIGFRMITLSDSYSPTIIKANTKNKKSKPKQVECVWINYTPISNEFANRTYTYADIYGTEKK